MAHAFDLAVNRFMRKLYSYYTSQLCHCTEGSLHLHEQISTCNSTAGSCRAIPWPWKAEDRFSVYSICCLFRLKYFVKMRSSLFEPQLQNGCHQAHLHRDSPLHVCFSQMMQNQSVLIHHAHGDMCAVADHADQQSVVMVWVISGHLSGAALQQVAGFVHSSMVVLLGAGCCSLQHHRLSSCSASHTDRLHCIHGILKRSAS